MGEGPALSLLPCLQCHHFISTLGNRNCTFIENFCRKNKRPFWSTLFGISSLIEFFNKMKKWEDMANLPSQFRERTERLERNFTVSAVIFKKYEPIFQDIFRYPQEDQPRQQRGRKQRCVSVISRLILEHYFSENVMKFLGCFSCVLTAFS